MKASLHATSSVRLLALLTVALLCLIAFALRLHALGRQSLWLDEGASFSIAASPLTSILSQTFTVEPNPPLYYIALHGFMRMAGQTELTLRFLSVLAGVALVPVLYRFGRLLAGGRVGLLAAALAVGSPYLVWYAQEARMYALLSLLAAASGLALTRAVRMGGWGRWTAFFVLAALTLYTHLYGLFSIAALLVAAAMASRSRRSALRIMLCALGLAAVYAPWLWATYLHRSQAPGWRDSLELPDLLERSAAAFTHGAFISGPLAGTAVWITVALASMGVLVMLCQRERLVGYADPRAAVLGLPIVMPLLIAYAASRIEPIYAERYVAAVAPFYYLAIAVSVSLLRRYSIVGMGIAVCLATALYWPALRASWSDPLFQKEEFRTAAAFVQERAGADDVILLAAPFIQMPFRYYYQGTAQIVPFGGDYANPRPFLDSVLTGRRTVWLVTSHVEDVDPGRRLGAWLASRFPENTEAYPQGIHINAFDLAYRPSELPREAVSVTARFENGLTLVGYQAEASVQPEDTMLHPPSNWLHATLFWRTDGPPSQHDVSEAYLLDRGGGIWGGKLHRPTDVGAIYPAPSRALGGLTVEAVDVNLNPATPPGEYLLAVGLLHPDGSAVPVVESTLERVGTGNLVLLAPVVVRDR